MVEILTKPGCPKCLSAKHKLGLLDIEYIERQTTDRELTEYGMQEVDLPVVLIDHEPFTYSAAMRKLKGIDDA